MLHVGIDLHKRESQICALRGEKVVREERVPTSRRAFDKAFGKQPKARILVESSTESEWVARHLETLGHEVIVADPNFAPMYATRSKRVKTDKRDARTLADACRLGAFRRAHRTSDEQRAIKVRDTVRATVIELRSKCISVTRAMLRSRGHRVALGSAEKFLARVAELPLSNEEQSELAPLFSAIEALAPAIADATHALTTATADDPQVRLAQSMPGVALVIAAALVAHVDGVERFDGARQVVSYFGLPPTELSSGESQRRGHITRAGNPRVRSLLIQGAWAFLRSKDPRTEPLKAWFAQLAARRGRRIAIVGLARRLTRILYAMLRDGAEFAPRARAA